jgi:hypothetical protein
MDHHRSNTAPGAGNLLRLITSLVWRMKWLIGGMVLVLTALAFALLPAKTDQVWSGRTILRIGLAPTIDYILLRSGEPMATIDLPKNTVARISEKDFKDQVAGRAAFDPATAAASRSMVAASLRAMVLDSDREISIELSAASAADVKAAIQAVTAEIQHEHGEILNRRLELLQTDIHEITTRLAVIEKSSERLNERAFAPGSDDGNSSHSTIFTLTPAAAIPAWNSLQDRLQQETILKKLSEPSRMRPEGDILLSGPRSVATLRVSLLAGVFLLVTMIILTIIVSLPLRSSAD